MGPDPRRFQYLDCRVDVGQIVLGLRYGSLMLADRAEDFSTLPPQGLQHKFHEGSLAESTVLCLVRLIHKAAGIFSADS